MHIKTAEKILEEVIKNYNQISEEFDKTRQREWEEFELFLPYIKENDYLVDLGCGNGRLHSFLQKHIQVRYLGIDNNDKLIEKARLAHPKAQFIEGDLLEIPMGSNKANVVAAIASFHHIPSKKLRLKALVEIHRILKPNGTLLLTSWNLFQPKYKKYIWFSWIKWLLSFGKYDLNDTFIPWGDSGVGRYYHAFTHSELKKLLVRNGFEILKEQKGNNFAFICKKK